MNVLMLYPRFPDETFWNSARSTRLLARRQAMSPPLGLLTVAAYLQSDFAVRLVDRNIGDETEADWEWADVVFLSLMLAQEPDATICISSARDSSIRRCVA